MGLDLEVRGTLVDQVNQWTSTCDALAHGEGASPDAVYPFTVTARADFTAELAAEFDHAVLALAGEESEACTEGRLATIRRTLEPGAYRLIVFARGGVDAGLFTLRHHAVPIAPRESVCTDASALPEGETTGAIEGASQFALAPGPEHVYVLSAAAAEHVRMTVTAGFEVSILEGCDESTVLRRSAQPALGERPARLEYVLAPGTYYVVVEGSGAYALTLTTTYPGPSEPCVSAPMLPVTYDEPMSFSLDTVGADNDTALSCGGGHLTPDATRRLRVDRPTELLLRASAAAHSATFAVRTSCGNGDSPGAELFCSRAADSIHPSVLQRLLLLPGSDYFVTVEGAAQSEVGETDLTADLRDLTELASACPNAPSLRLGASRVVEDMPAARNLAPRTGLESEGAVYRLVIARTQHVRLRLQASVEGVMGFDVRRDCLDPRSSRGLSDGYAREHVLELDLEPGTYFVHTWLSVQHRPTGDVTLSIESE